MCDPVSWVTDTIDSVAGAVGDVISGVGDAVGGAIDAALNDPIGTIAKIAAVATGNAYLLPYISAADTIAHGGDINAVIGSMAASYAGGVAGGAAGDWIGQAAADAGSSAATSSFLDNMVTGAIRSGVTAELMGGDPLQALVQGGIAGGTPAVLNQIPGFRNLPVYAQRAAASAVTAELSGGSPSAALIDSALNAGITAAGQAAKQGESATYVNALVNPTDYATQDLGAAQGSTWADLQNTIKSLQGGTFDPTQWTQDANGNFVMSADNGTAITVDPTGKILDTTYGLNPADFAPQDFGADPTQYFDSYQQNLQRLQDAGELPTQWAEGQNGAFTYTADDGSTITIDANGNVTSSTEAPAANLLSALRGQVAAPIVRPVASAGGKGGTQTGTQSGGMDLAGMLGLMSMLGGDQQQVQQPVQVQPADVKSFEEQGYGSLFGGDLKFSSGGDVDTLLALLRG